MLIGGVRADDPGPVELSTSNSGQERKCGRELPEQLGDRPAFAHADGPAEAIGDRGIGRDTQRVQ